MTVQPNGTDAKDVALHFIKVTVGRATPQIVQKTVVQAKSLLSSGYTKDEIIKTIDHIIDKKKVEMYSLGYVNSCINNVLKEIKTEESKVNVQEVKQQIQQQLTEHNETKREEVKQDGESTERNRNKLNRFGVQPRFGEKLDFDLFERHRKDN